MKRVLKTIDKVRFRPSWKQRNPSEIVSHPDYGVIYHGVVCDDDGTPVYDLPFIAEPVGAICVPIDLQKNLYFVKQRRPIPSRGPYIEFPPKDFINSGRDSLELPRGYAEKDEAPEDTAKRETEEETGLFVKSVLQIGESNCNTTYNLKSIPVFIVNIDSTVRANTTVDDAEDITGICKLSWDDVRSRVMNGEIFCGFTLSALFLASVSELFS